MRRPALHPTRTAGPRTEVECPFCQKMIRLSDSRGTILEHMKPRPPGSPWPLGCPGSNHTPSAAARLAR